ncbi:uncharacterized protein [Aristolochia californica]|uniref:uncharacterized protein isoform X2 n=1 Tax=Aristolochia californica TaxID=171875 RepID=UPI0035D61059
MTAPQFAMVEELAFLIKDNLSSKHIVLSIEEALVDLLQKDTRFAHKSVGEGDNRHLILERCPDSSIPAVLVSDILGQYDHSTTNISSYQLLRRKEAVPESRMETASFQPSTPFEEREAAYLAARERIFSLDAEDIKQSFTPKQRNVPVVARRMIAHALGQKISSAINAQTDKIHEDQNEPAPKLKVEASEDTIPSSLRQSSGDRRKSSKSDRPVMVQREKVSGKATREGQGNSTIFQDGMNEKIGINKEGLKLQDLGAAKRMFAHALGLPKEYGGIQLKCTDASRQLGLKS